VSSTAPDTAGLSAQEQADRTAIEAVWTESWDIYLALPGTPDAERRDRAASVAVDPALAGMLKDAAAIAAQGLDTYGKVGHRISWTMPIDGADHALISDCQDLSQTGSYDIATGEKKTVGVERQSMQGSLVKQDDGTWKLAEVYYLRDEPC
jgi:hypothetical protein